MDKIIPDRAIDAGITVCLNAMRQEFATHPRPDTTFYLQWLVDRAAELCAEFNHAVVVTRLELTVVDSQPLIDAVNDLGKAAAVATEITHTPALPLDNHPRGFSRTIMAPAAFSLQSAAPVAIDEKGIATLVNPPKLETPMPVVRTLPMSEIEQRIADAGNTGKVQPAAFEVERHTEFTPVNRVLIDRREKCIPVREDRRVVLDRRVQPAFTDTSVVHHLDADLIAARDQRKVPMVNVLKTHPKWFAGLWDGSKPFEIRFDDRGYKVGDKMILREFDPESQGDPYSGRAIERTITCMVTSAEFPGLHYGYVALGFDPHEESDNLRFMPDNLVERINSDLSKELNDIAGLFPDIRSMDTLIGGALFKRVKALCDRVNAINASSTDSDRLDRLAGG